MVTGLRKTKLKHPEHAKYFLANLYQFLYQEEWPSQATPLPTKKRFQSALQYEENQDASPHPPQVSQSYTSYLHIDKNNSKENKNVLILCTQRALL